MLTNSYSPQSEDKNDIQHGDRYHRLCHAAVHNGDSGADHDYIVPDGPRASPKVGCVPGRGSNSVLSTCALQSDVSTTVQ